MENRNEEKSVENRCFDICNIKMYLCFIRVFDDLMFFNQTNTRKSLIFALKRITKKGKTFFYHMTFPTRLNFVKLNFYC